MMRPKNYLNNKDILKEIHKSKNKFNSYLEPEFGQYDIILSDVSKINRLTVAEAKRNKAKKMSSAEYERRKGLGEKVKQAECETLASEITKEELIFRVITFQKSLGVKRTQRQLLIQKLNFLFRRLSITSTTKMVKLY
jgi:hypothetical protein